ncbi:MAG: exodeoxyribonuclease VII large subunit, partial [Bacteroidetes bacterium]|nr:exodeoxyribonuclease VII large subunit [Bacteroidota bacterium]
MENSSSVSLLELNSQIKSCLHKGFMAPVWVRAEINQYNEHYSGHCYIELIEKGANTDSIQASVRATIWASAFRRIKAHFETSTGQCLSEGIKVLVRAHVDYHEVYGISLNIREIDPNYTLGDLARKRLETMRKLEATGIMDMNKELPFPVVPQRIAIISSLSAAGYEDFTNQMQQNKNKIHYYLKLFPATMQGSSVPLSIMAALDKV